MSRNLEDLEPGFRNKVEIVLARCKEKGYSLKPFFTVRHPIKQARLWRQSRPWSIIESALDLYSMEGADFLHRCLKEVGPQNGPWRTNALPGESWHQWAEAIDCFVESKEVAIWDSTHRGYITYAAEAQKVGLVAGRYWSKSDPVHVQNQKYSVTKIYSWEEVNNLMEKKFTIK